MKTSITHLESRRKSDSGNALREVPDTCKIVFRGDFL